METNQVFRKELLDSYSSLQNFLSGKEARKEILSYASSNPSRLHLPAPYATEMSRELAVCQLMTAPFRALFATFLKAISRLVYSLGDTQNAKKIRNWGKK